MGDGCYTGMESRESQFKERIVSFAINTNVSSLQAQEYLRGTSEFQTKTISRVTSGLRIISSGDDAAGLAIANGYRSDRAVLEQGVRNANDGLSQLQIVDGGINNISKLLDRARSLATQSASGSFTGDRNVLNSEFQSVIGEIDRQAQAIGLDTNGTFARTVSVFIGGGRANGGTTAITNGSVSVNLSNSAVDARSLGLKGVQSAGKANTDIGTGSATTTVSQIVTDATNLGSLAAGGFSDFYFTGPGFADNEKVKVSVNLAGVTDTGSLVTALNAAIESAGNGGTQQATAFKNANIRATINTDSAGRKQLAFTSSTTSFQTQAGDRVSNALLGNFSSGATGRDLTNSVSGAATVAGTLSQNVIIRIQGAGLGSPVDLQINSGTTTANALTTLSSLVANNSALQAAGITLGTPSVGSALTFTNKRGETFNVSAIGDVATATASSGLLGLGSYQNSTAIGTAFEYTTITAGTAYAAAAKTNTFSLSFGGGAAENFSIAVGATDTVAQAIDKINTALAGNTAAKAAGIVADNNGGSIRLTSSNGTAFRLSATTATGSEALGFGTNGSATALNTSTLTDTANSVFYNNAGGSSVLNASGIGFQFNGILNADDDQTVTIAARDTAGAEQTLSVVLRNDSTERNARSLDEAINTINTKLQQSNNETLKKVVAVKDYDTTSQSYRIRFQSTLSSFNVSFGNSGNATAVGIGAAAEQGVVYSSAAVAGGSTSDISSETQAQAAVSALATAVASLGTAQAVVGRGQNQFNFAINLAQSQVTNVAAAESRIRDADLASEAANLTKAQILLQAGVAALAQANSAPQQILSLLRG